MLATTQVAAPPVVAASSSQYFERTFNRLVAAHPVQPVIPVAPVPAVFVEPVTRTVPAAPVPVNPTQNVPVEPNVAIAIATAHAAAPVATILLPPYPFGLPPGVGFVPSFPPTKVPQEESRKESTTPQTTTTIREPEPTTPLPQPSNTDNSFAQPLLPSNSNQNVNFNQQYGAPLPLPAGKPQKLKTAVEVVPVPLAYIAPPPLNHHHHHHHHANHAHLQAKSVRYVHTFIPSSQGKVIIRPVSAPIRVRTVRVPARLVIHKIPVLAKKGYTAARSTQNALRRSNNIRDTEPTTFNPFNRPNSTKPPRL